MSKRRRPNVVLMITDQQRADTMPGARTATVHTPHLHWLSAQATRFDRAYCTFPICTPARASILSGLYPHQHRMVSNHQPRPISDQMHLPPDVRLLADYLRPAGYACGYSGKWHLGTGSDRRAFRELAIRSGDYDVDQDSDNEHLRFARRGGFELGGKKDGRDVDRASYDQRLTTGTTPMPLAFHRSARDASHAARFIRDMGGDQRPFLLVYSCEEPHPPFVAPVPFFGMYEPAAMPLPASRRDAAGPALMARRSDWQLAPTADLTDADLQAMWAAYYGQIAYVDYLLGLLLEALIDSDQLDETLVIFTSDHGEMLGSHGMWRKGAAMYEELMRIPLLIKPQRLAAAAGGTATDSVTPVGQTSAGAVIAEQSAQLVSHVDLLPTVLGWCDVEPPATLPGVDLRPLIAGVDRPLRDGVAFEYHSTNWGEQLNPLRGWRTERWKYVEGLHGAEELYDLKADPHELHNLVHEPGAEQSRTQLQAELASWLTASGDNWPEVPQPPQLVERDMSGARWQ